MSLVPNAAAQRLRYIAKTYEKKPWIVIDMIDVVAQAVGDDQWRAAVSAAASADPHFEHDLRELHGLSTRSQVFHWIDDIRRNEVPVYYAQLATALVDLVAARPRLNEPHDADGAFAWMATQLAQIASQLRAVRGDEEHVAREVERIGQKYVLAWKWLRERGTAFGQWLKATRPNLTKLTLDDVKQEVENYTEEHEPTPQGEIVYEFDDGHTVQKLTTGKQLDAEGEVMQHCVGNYCEDVAKGRMEIYSLRDPQGEPHATIEWSPKKKRVVQVKGKQNVEPAEKYQLYVDTFIGDKLGVSPELYRFTIALEEAGVLDDEEFTTADAKRWHEARFSADEVEEWIGADIYDPELAQSLTREGILPRDVQGWPYEWQEDIRGEGDIDQYVTATRVAYAAREREKSKRPFGWEGEDPHQLDLPGVHRTAKRPRLSHDESALDEVKRWGELGVHGSESIIDWLSDGFRADTAEPWLAIANRHNQIESGDAAQYRSAMVTPDEVKEALERDHHLRIGDVARVVREIREHKRPVANGAPRVLSAAEAARLPVGSIVFEWKAGRPNGSPLVVIPGGLLTQIPLLPQRSGGEEPGGDPAEAFGNEFAFVAEGHERLPTKGTASRLANEWFEQLRRR